MNNGFGVIYNAFDGLELLEASLRNVRDEADAIVVVYQTTSHFGNTIDIYNISDVIDYLKGEGLIDYAIHKNYDPVKTIGGAKSIEIDKRNIGLQKLHELGINYFRISDVDEFFDPQQFKDAFNFGKESNYNRFFCRIKTFSDVKKQDLVESDGVNTSAFYRIIDRKHRIGPSSHPTPIRIDSNRKYGIAGDGKSYTFKSKDLLMYHYRLVRLDLHTKLENSAGNAKCKEITRRQIKEVQEKKIKTITSDKDFGVDLDKFVRMFVTEKKYYNDKTRKIVEEKYV